MYALQSVSIDNMAPITWHGDMYMTDKDVNSIPTFSILIPSWNNLDFLKLCVSSIRKNSRFTHQIVLHINEGSDGSKEWADQEGLSYSYTEKNVGVCIALNSAFDLATAEYIVYLNDDMYVCPDWDYHLWQAIQSIGHTHFFLSSTAIEPKDVGKGCAIAPYTFGRSPKEFDEKGLLEQYSSFEFNDWNGSSWPPNIVHRSMWEKVGGYSIEFFPGFYSDPDFAIKLWKAGVRIFWGVSMSRVYHFLEVSTNKLKRQRVKQANLQFLKKWGISARFFNRFYLQMGTPYHGVLAVPKTSLSYVFKWLGCKTKQILH